MATNVTGLPTLGLANSTGVYLLHSVYFKILTQFTNLWIFIFTQFVPLPNLCLYISQEYQLRCGLHSVKNTCNELVSNYIMLSKYSIP